MNADGSAFMRRARYLLAELRLGRYPNASSLQRFDGCSRSTAMRVIMRLQSEYNCPLAFEATEREYYLTDDTYSCEFMPPGKDEYCALFLLKQLADTVGSDDVRRAVESLWHSAIGDRPALLHDLIVLDRHFSADLTAVSILADTGVLDLVSRAASGHDVKIMYKSPWRHTSEREYLGRIERVHLSDGTVYVLITEHRGRRLTLNAAFIRSVDVLTTPLVFAPLPHSEVNQGWLDGFGVWANQEIHAVEIAILSPAAEYYASQCWHTDRSDRWEGDVLIRSMPAMLSPELTRRIISLGRYVRSINPPELKELVKNEAQLLLERLAYDG